MKDLVLDIETFSSVDLAKCGVYKYAASEDFEILLFAYSGDYGPVQVVDLASGESIPCEILDALQNPNIIKHAFNAAFERVCLSFWLAQRKILPTDQNGIPAFLGAAGWHCDMVWCAYLSLPLSLEKAGAVLKVEQQKMKEGKDLIKYFCIPCKPTKTNGGRGRNLPGDDPEKWQLFKAYNKRDVETEIAIEKKISKVTIPHNIIPHNIWKEYELDQQINDRGVLIDMDLVKAAMKLDEQSRDGLVKEMCSLTMLENPNSVVQLKGWLVEKGYEVESLGKKEVEKMLEDAPEDIAKVLGLRLQLAKSSIKKYQAMENYAGADGRARGLFQFYGASRTGRWAGRGVQLQNLRRNDLPDLVEARELVKSGNGAAVELLYDSIPDTLSQLVRTALIPEPGKKFIVADFSAIEARVLSWLAGETWRMETFESGGDIYCATASKMFHCNVVKHGENGDLRQKGKQAELACIAEDELVLTDHGLKEIQSVSVEDRVWDGENWVHHDGVIERGVKLVLLHDGLWATADHMVITDGKWMPHGAAIILRNEGKTEMAQKRTYDILNAGPHHRFTVSGRLVHNCGYGGSVGAMKAMGALEMGMQEEELKPLVDAWRAANPKIVDFWWEVDEAIKECVRTKERTGVRNIGFRYQSGMLLIDLPSGRSLVYIKPRIEENDFGGESITYMGIGATKKWERLESYGPKFVENIVQAIARDLLMESMKRMDGMRIVAHVHDEVIIEAVVDDSVEKTCRLMAVVPDWAEGLVLNADGYECGFYMKD